MAGKNNSTNYQPTQYNVLVGAANNGIANVAPSSTTGYALTSNGASSNPSFQAVPGALVLLSTQTASSSASISFTSLISATYSSYRIIFSNVVASSGASVDLEMLFSTNNGSGYISSGYFTGINACEYNSSTFSNTNQTSYCVIENGVTSSTNGSGIINLYNLDTSVYPSYDGLVTYKNTSSDAYLGLIIGSNSTTSGVNALQFKFSSGNITSGTFSLYGIKQ